jgi:hypothetical protein
VSATVSVMTNVLSHFIITNLIIFHHHEFALSTLKGKLEQTLFWAG